MKDIKDYLHLYFGCDVRITINIEGNPVIEKLTAKVLADEIECHIGIKPILRRLNDMTDEEKAECKRLMTQGTDGVHNVVISVYSFESMRYMLSIGIDLFNLIPEGLAIDSKTLK
jgi:hypothetical protein